MNPLHNYPASDLLAALQDHPDLRKEDLVALGARAIKLASSIFQVSISDLLERDRSPHLIPARFVTMSTLHDLGLTLSDIARIFDGRHHGAVIHACKRAVDLSADPGTAPLVQRLRSSLALPPLEACISSQSSVQSPKTPL